MGQRTCVCGRRARVCGMSMGRGTYHFSLHVASTAPQEGRHHTNIHSIDFQYCRDRW